jgi:hypothetical protein
MTPVVVACQPSPCRNGGSCFQFNSTIYICVCSSPYSGKHCETVSCKSLQMNRQRTCSTIVICKQQQHVVHRFVQMVAHVCQYPVKQVGNVDVQQDSLANDVNKQSTVSFSRRHVWFTITILFMSCLVQGKCASQPCTNGGTCFEGPFTYDCKCSMPYRGTRCELVSSSYCEYNYRTYESCLIDSVHSTMW